MRVLAVDVSKGAKDPAAAVTLQSGGKHSVVGLDQRMPRDLHDCFRWTQGLLARYTPDFWCFDSQGVGREFRKLVEASPAAGLWFPIVPHPVRSARQDPRDGAVLVAPRQLVDCLFGAICENRFRCPPDLPLAGVLRQQIRNFRMEQDPVTGRYRFGAPRGQHDDLIAAAAMAVFVSRQLAAQGELTRWKANGAPADETEEERCQ